MGATSQTGVMETDVQADASPLRSPIRRERPSVRRWAFIPARKGSVGVPHKNIRPFAGGMSLLERAVRVANALEAFTLVVTDYAVNDLPMSVRPFYTPHPEMGPKHSVLDMLVRVGNQCEWDEMDDIILLQPTSLSKPPESRVALIKSWMDASFSVVSAWKVPERWHPDYAQNPDEPHQPPRCRQGLPPRYRPNGLFYIMGGRTARDNGLWQSQPTFVECDCFNIDTQADWDEAEQAYGHL